jgi:hypothetical protein
MYSVKGYLKFNVKYWNLEVAINWMDIKLNVKVIYCTFTKD